MQRVRPAVHGAHRAAAAAAKSNTKGIPSHGSKPHISFTRWDRSSGGGRERDRDRGRSRSNVSFLLGALVGVSIAGATALYLSHTTLPPRRRLSSAISELRQRDYPSSIDPSDLAVHGSSAYFPQNDSGTPDIVVWPRGRADVSDVMRVASRYNVAVVAYGGGTSIEGQFSPCSGGISIDLSHMDAVHAVDLHNMTATVGPGVRWQDLNEHLRPLGLFFPVDPGPGATIGGCVGTRCSGPNAARYGTMEAWVVTMEVVLASGEVFRTRSLAKKSSSGYDLNHLFIGAEGTLGVVTEVTVRLAPLPEAEVVGTCAFPSARAVTQAVVAVGKAGLPAQCLELVDDGNIPATNTYNGLSLPEKPHLFFKLSGRAHDMPGQQDLLQHVCESHGGTGFAVADEPEKVWGARKNLLLAQLASHTDCKALSTDVCVPLSLLPDLVERYKARAAELDLRTTVVGHAADGNCHTLILYTPEELTKANQLADELSDIALSLGGTVSGEHGIGSHKRHSMEKEHGSVAIGVMRDIKRVLDPLGILNPGKLLPD
ncbi:D-lactate ferricytochrome c oxidoreductase [Savitreella phatthalungensis]